MRVPYDPNQGTWGQAETVLSAKDTGRSILLPRISPDGRWLLVSMCDYGCFPVYRKSSDLYMIDLEAAAADRPVRVPPAGDQQRPERELAQLVEQQPLDRVQQQAGQRDSSRGRTSSYVDPNGMVHKPLVLPQKDPTHYDSCLWTYSVPELVTQPVRATKETLGRVVRGSRKISVEMPVTMATPKADKTPQADNPYLSTPRMTPSKRPFAEARFLDSIGSIFRCSRAPSPSG